MTWALENPVPIVVVAILLEVVLGGILWISGRAKTIVGMVVVLVLAGALIAVERWVETDREQIEAVIDDVADGLVKGDVERVQSHLSKNAGVLLRELQTRLVAGSIKQAEVAGEIEIVIPEGADPPTARARFIALAVVKLGGYTFGPQRQSIEVWFVKEEGEWKALKYSLPNLSNAPFQQ